MLKEQFPVGEGQQVVVRYNATVLAKGDKGGDISRFNGRGVKVDFIDIYAVNGEYFQYAPSPELIKEVEEKFWSLVGPSLQAGHKRKELKEDEEEDRAYFFSEQAERPEIDSWDEIGKAEEEED